ncbi:MAG: type II secretion system protein GspH [Betaproteobacteria bacterium]|nr:MAG: type II secretion system protein GspH [Betaproteobacteria bacterium]
MLSNYLSRVRRVIRPQTARVPLARVSSFTKSNVRRAFGFTMIEMIAVILVIAVVAALSPPLFSSGVSASQHRAAAREVAGMLRLARTEAVAKRMDMGVDFDLEARTVQIPNAANKRIAKIPEGIEINLTTTAAETKNETQASVRFYPDGGATGGRVTLKVRDRSYLVDIDWLTGRVSIDEA